MGYYSRYLRVCAFSSAELDRVASYRIIKGWCRGRVLDFGCGTGYLTNYLGAVGTDRDPEALALARRLFPRIPFYSPEDTFLARERFGTVVCYNVVEHMTGEERTQAFAMIRGFLEQGGRVIFGYSDPFHFIQLLKGAICRSAFFDPTHKYNWTIRRFRDIVSAEFPVLEQKNSSPFTRWTGVSRFLGGELLLLCSSGGGAGDG